MKPGDNSMLATRTKDKTKAMLQFVLGLRLSMDSSLSKLNFHLSPIYK
jgi:hypothetical protein